jgi:hypothetical protein
LNDDLFSVSGPFLGYTHSHIDARFIVSGCQQDIPDYKGWQDKSRQVRKGEKAIWLCMPITRKKRKEDTDEDEVSIACFVWRPNWFVLAQTDGESVPHA